MLRSSFVYFFLRDPLCLESSRQLDICLGLLLMKGLMVYRPFNITFYIGKKKNEDCFLHHESMTLFFM